MAQKTLIVVYHFNTTLSGKKDKHNLIISAQEVKHDYILALEELTRLLNTTDDLLAM